MTAKRRRNPTFSFILSGANCLEVGEEVVRANEAEIEALRKGNLAALPEGKIILIPANVAEELKKRQQKTAKANKRVSADDGASKAVPVLPPQTT